MLEIWSAWATAILAVCAGLVFGWALRGRATVKPPHVVELERMRAELRVCVGLLADKDARIATLEANLEQERTGIVRFEPERRGAQLARRQFG